MKARELFKIGDKVRTTRKHNEIYKYVFEGVIDDIHSDIIVVYGNVISGIGKSNNKYLSEFSLQEIEPINKSLYQYLMKPVDVSTEEEK